MLFHPTTSAIHQKVQVLSNKMSPPHILFYVSLYLSPLWVHIKKCSIYNELLVIYKYLDKNETSPQDAIFPVLLQLKQLNKFTKASWYKLKNETSTLCPDHPGDSQFLD